MKPSKNNPFDTRFFERYAKISLVQLVDSQLVHLENSDRPDLQDKVRSIGIEVTRAIREDKDVAHALINKMAGQCVAGVSTADWHEIANHGYGYGIHEHWIGTTEYNYWATAWPLTRIIENKVSKVNKGFYGCFDQFGLYIFTKDALTASNVQEAMAYTTHLQQNNTYKYNTLYISQINELFVCDLHNLCYQQIAIGLSQRRQFYHAAIQND